MYCKIFQLNFLLINASFLKITLRFIFYIIRYPLNERISLFLTMPVLSPTYVILSAILHNVLYIHHPPNVDDVFICFDNGGVRNESWPDNWTPMSPHTSFGVPTLTSLVPDSANDYKLRMIFHDRSTGDSSWSKLKPQCQNVTKIIPEPYKCHLPEKLDLSTESGLLYYISLCSTIIISKLLAKVIRKKWVTRMRS
jgi:hypothetical protein